MAENSKPTMRPRRKVAAGANYAALKAVFSISSLVAAGLWSAIVPTNAQVNVTQYHNHSSRDGLYVDSALSRNRLRRI